MAHQAQRDYCSGVKVRFSSNFEHARVLDVGSLDINGCNRPFFKDCEYVGVDVGPGRNVDIVCFCHELAYLPNTFDTIISTECFEHDPYLAKSLPNIYRMLKPGGLFVFTCATTGRPEHGTVLREPADSPLTVGMPELSHYYKNITEIDIRSMIDIDRAFSSYAFATDEVNHDLRFWGVKNA